MGCKWGVNTGARIYTKIILNEKGKFITLDLNIYKLQKGRIKMLSKHLKMS